MSGKILENGEENVSDSSQNKRMKQMPIDRLTALPDGILIHILSFLGLKESAVTSVLSKRWEFIWTELPRLEFYEESKESDKIRQFAAMINRTLLIRRGAHLEKFYVHFIYDESFASDVDYWLDFVLKNKVKEVCLHLMSRTEENLYRLPETMYSNPSLIWFSVHVCNMDTLAKIDWRSLTRLDINDATLPQHVIENILSGCPVLHALSLEECQGFNCLDIKSQNMYELKVYDLEDRENGSLLEISAPHVHTLDILFNPAVVKLVLRKTDSLDSVEINYFESELISEEKVINITEKLFEILRDVKELKLGRHYFKVLSEMVINGWQLPVSRRKCLTVFTNSEDEYNISGIFALLKFSPNLERLAIEGFEPEGELWDDYAMADLDCDLVNLKTVRISEFADPVFGGEPMLTVARNLLKRATALEEMTTRLGAQELDDHINITEALLSYPRSSAKAVVRLR
ncbi:hypothetical protein CASFOL_002716 [Castilleja foliolosa]|uniref:FBD domain-containing protein n=1 Tax=Castilleja foliolosa TaxID=1961234 RepID=A0ABD3EIU1_9LAMI